jgi:predicted nucleic acid-binding protein
MRRSEESAILELFDHIEWIPVDDALAERAGRLANSYLRSHPGIGAVDYVIAATAERLAADLWTSNVRHFPMFPGLQPPY